MGNGLRYAVLLCITAVAPLQIVLAQSQTLTVERSYCRYRKSLQQFPYLEMVELKKAIPNLVYDLRYASPHNFMRRYMYPAGTSVTFLRKPATDSLAKVQEELQKEGLGLKIFDAYRPYTVTKNFWNLVKDERYVAHPAKGSYHNRGTAIDLTLINTHTGAELDMGTGFDNFSDTAHHNFSKLPQKVLENREKLKGIMLKYGFKALATEWWHYTYDTDIAYPVMDLTFKKLASRQRRLKKEPL